MLNDQVPLVSVIIPVYNAEPFLGKTIQSVIGQTIPDIEILVVDDGSTDGSRALIDHLLLLDPRIKKIVQKKRGVSAARNLGFQHSKGDYIAFLDADDVWLPENLELKLNKIKQGDFGMVHSNGMVISEEGKFMDQILGGCEGNLLDGLLSWEKTQIPGPSSILIARSEMNVVGLFDEKLSTSADKDFFIRVAAHFPIGHVDQVTWQYRLHKENMHKNIALMQHDTLILYNKAKLAHLFVSRQFEQKCFVNMYLILAASWAGDGNNKLRALNLVCRAILVHPLFFLTAIWRRIVK
jgi:glycosyltransferase involved in cell wall biosynthesis